jgi:predicted negative regulator of RcsB-dependent stress response
VHPDEAQEKEAEMAVAVVVVLVAVLAGWQWWQRATVVAAPLQVWITGGSQ